MTKSKKTEVEVEVEVNSGGRSYYCGGRSCTKKEKCHRYTSGEQAGHTQFDDDYDIIMLHEQPAPCKYFVNILSVPTSSNSIN